MAIIERLGLDLTDAGLAASRDHDDRADAVMVLRDTYGSRGGEEALLRALHAERDGDHLRAAFWAGVFMELRVTDLRC